MKVHDFAYQVAMRTIALMEEKQHYKVADENRREITEQILEEVDQLLAEAQKSGKK